MLVRRLVGYGLGSFLMDQVRRQVEGMQQIDGVTAALMRWRNLLRFCVPQDVHSFL